jgi:hypothetical protein
MTATPPGGRAHAALGASSYYRWSACSGSVRLSAGIESESSAYAEEGTAAHELAEVCLNNGQDAIEWTDRKLPAKYGSVYVTGEMAEAVQVYLDYVRPFILAGDQVQIEHRFDLSGLGILVPVYDMDGGIGTYKPLEMFGTADCVIYLPDHKKLIVADYKHGAGIAVEAEGNPQLRYYALGALLTMPDAVIESIEVVIVQPRAFHPAGPVRSETLDLFDMDCFRVELIEAAKRTQDPDAPLFAGAHCRFCPAHPVCPAQQSRALAVLESDFDVITIPPAPETLSVERLGQILRAADGVENWLKAVRSHAYRIASEGGTVPGFKLVAGKEGNRTWADEDDAAFALSLAGVADEDLYIRKLITPAAAERIVGKKAAKELAGYVARKPGVPTLVPQSDKRPAIEGGAGADFVALPFE